ncbi:hypothetical protein BGW39_008270 [Mortierella sp. 14UC]|nr:hypothetical protein BGW39_008270 [Mortierella sp. 14UC]
MPRLHSKKLRLIAVHSAGILYSLSEWRHSFAVSPSFSMQSDLRMHSANSTRISLQLDGILDLEAAALSCYGYNGQARARPRSTSQMLSRLKSLLARDKDQFAQQSLLHGYMFDAWSGRKCTDQFLELKAKWPLDTDAYLKLLIGLDLGDQLLATLLTVTTQEITRLVGLVLESSEVTVELFGRLFIWTVDQIDCRYRKRQDPSHQQDIRSNPGEIIRLWTDRAKECESIRRLFRASFKHILRQLIVRHSRHHRGGISYWDLGDKSQVETTQTGVADEIIQGLLADIITTLIEHPAQGEGKQSCQFAQEIYEDIERWDQFSIGSGSKLSELLSSIARNPKRRKQEESTTMNSKDMLRSVLQIDAELTARKNKSGTVTQENGLQRVPCNDHQEAFITICGNLRQKQDFPGYPPTPMSTLATYRPLDSHQQRGEILQEHIEWIESTIRHRSAGWLSCAKLKLQFFAVFGESYVNEEFADIVCDHDLHWDLCSTLLRYLRRFRVDPTRMTADTFQLGCELLLSVFTKRVELRLSLRDHLFHQSNTICKDARGPLFGSWDFWRVNIDTLLTSTLNQVVVSEDSPQSSAVSPNTVEALVKHLLHKPTADEDSGPGLAWSDQQQANFVDFVSKAMARRSSTTGMLVLDPTEFLTACVAPYLDEMMETGRRPSPLFRVVTQILLRIYEPEPVQVSSAAVAGVFEGERLLPRGIQLQILLRLLQLRTRENPWTAEGQGCRRKPSVDRCGGEHLDGLSRLCEAIVLRMNAYVSSLTEFEQDERELFSEFLQSIQEASSEPVDLESALVVVPLMEACRRNMALDVGLPCLPAGLFGLCGDGLKVFEYSGSILQHRDVVLSVCKAAEALVLCLDLGRMCDDVLADMIQAIENGGNVPPSVQHMLRLIMAPALYRVLSISTHHQSHRLLTHTVPVMAQLWGGPSDPSLFWDDEFDSSSAQHSQLPTLGPYWDKFKHGSRQQKENEKGEGSETALLENVGDALDVLLTLETILRFSLDPLPIKNVEVVLQVYRSDVGYDMMPDQSIRIEWTKMPLDHLLYCFMKVCKMSNIVDTRHQDNHYPNRLIPQAELSSSALPSNDNSTSTDEALSTWRNMYLKHMIQPMDGETRGQSDVARAKARDELVLMAMNLSEALVNHQDKFYGHVPDLATALTQDGGHARGRRGRGGRGRGRGRGGLEQKGGGNNEVGERGEAGGHGRNRQEARQAASGQLDKGTQAWFNGIMTSPILGKVTNTNDVQENQGETSNTCMPDASGAQQQDIHKAEEPKKMLNVDQVDCLLLALAYLPAQESQAVRSRLHRLLNAQPTKPAHGHT